MRTLAIASFCFSAAAFAGCYLLPFAWLIPVGAILGIAGLLLALTRRLWLRPLALALLSAAVGLGCFYVHDLRTTVPARLLDGSTLEIEAQVLDYPKRYQGYCRAEVKITNEEYPRLRAIVYDGSYSLAERLPGQRVRFPASLRSADTRYGRPYDAYNARDVYFIMYTESEAELIDGASGWRFLPQKLHHDIVERIGKIFPKDAAAFMRSLLLGDKEELYQDQALLLAVSRAGNMHVLAVSGLHIAFLIGAIQLLLGNTPFGSLLGIVIVWAFVLITGAPPSALRAAIMMTILLLAPILRRENDPPTTLAFALSLLLLHNPRAAASVSLQLSFAAMAGILLFGGPLERSLLNFLPAGRVRRLFSGLAAAAASSLAVLPFTIPLMAIHFGYVSVLAPLTNLLCYPVISLCFCGGYLACGLSLVSLSAGKAAAALCAWLARYLIAVSRAISALPFAALYFSTPMAALWIVFAYAVFILAHFLPLHRAIRLLAPAALSALALALLLSGVRRCYNAEEGFVSALDVGQGQCLCFFSGENTVVVDCGGSRFPNDPGETAGRYLVSHGRRQIDTLILTHMDEDHVNGVTMLMEMLPVRLLLLPGNANDENGFLSQILDKAAEKGTRHQYVFRDSRLRIGGIQASLLRLAGGSGRNDGGIVVLVHQGSFDTLIPGDLSGKSEERFVRRYRPSEIELLIAPHHGSRYSCGETLLESIGADTAVISVGYNNYGHPAEETLERLAGCGYNVYRTDENGSITIRIVNGYGKEIQTRRS